MTNKEALNKISSNIRNTDGFANDLIEKVLEMIEMRDQDPKNLVLENDLAYALFFLEGYITALNTIVAGVCGCDNCKGRGK
jgi:hypothetical protein